MANNPRKPAVELAPIRAASAGLLYPSESDAPFEVFDWDRAEGTTASDQVAAHSRKGEPVEVVSADAFFAALDETDDAAGYRALRRVLEANLTELTVVRVGRVKVAVYLIGRTRSGRWAGLRTTSVET